MDEILCVIRQNQQRIQTQNLFVSVIYIKAICVGIRNAVYATQHFAHTQNYIMMRLEIHFRIKKRKCNFCCWATQFVILFWIWVLLPCKLICRLNLFLYMLCFILIHSMDVTYVRMLADVLVCVAVYVCVFSVIFCLVFFPFFSLSFHPFSFSSVFVFPSFPTFGSVFKIFRLYNNAFSRYSLSIENGF